MKQDLLCKATIGDFDNLHRSLDRVRSNSKTVKVDRGALMRVLLDHSDYYDRLLPYYNIIEPEGEENAGMDTT